MTARAYALLFLIILIGFPLYIAYSDPSLQAWLVAAVLVIPTVFVIWRLHLPGYSYAQGLGDHVEGSLSGCLPVTILSIWFPLAYFHIRSLFIAIRSLWEGRAALERSYIPRLHGYDG